MKLNKYSSERGRQMIHIICSVCKDLIGEFEDLAKAGEYSQDRTKSRSFSELQEHGFVNVCSVCEDIYDGLDLKECIRRSISACKESRRE